MMLDKLYITENNVYITEIEKSAITFSTLLILEALIVDFPSINVKISFTRS